MPTGKILVYDGDCSLCEAASGLLVRSRLLPAEARRPFASFPLEVAARLEAAGIRNEMAVIDPETGEIQSGIQGILWRFATGGTPLVAPLARLAGRPAFLPLLTFFYRIVSYNRRVLAPPRRPGGVRCACDPDDRPAYQLAFLLLCLAAAGGLTLLFGETVPRVGAWRMLVAAGSGWALLLTAGFTLQRPLPLRFATHLGMVMILGLFAVLPAILLAPALSPGAREAAAGLAAAASLLVMARSLRRRLLFLGLPLTWLAGWALALGGGAGLSLWLLLPRLAGGGR